MPQGRWSVGASWHRRHRRHRVGGAGDVGTGPVKGEGLKKLSYRVIYPIVGL